MSDKKILWIEGENHYAMSASNYAGHEAFASFPWQSTDSPEEGIEIISEGHFKGVFMVGLKSRLPILSEELATSALPSEIKGPYCGRLLLARYATKKSLPVLVRPYNDREVRAASSAGLELFNYDSRQEKEGLGFELALARRFEEVFGV